MSSKSRLLVFVLGCAGFTLPALAQLDSSALREKYGPPLHREIFHLPPGFDLIADYDAADQVCRVEVPALLPTNEKVRNSSQMKQRMDDFLLELVPLAMRGKELGRLASMMGMISLSPIEYEHVTISELDHADQPFGNNTITVTFKDRNCRAPSGS